MQEIRTFEIRTDSNRPESEKGVVQCKGLRGWWLGGNVKRVRESKVLCQDVFDL